MTVPRAAVAASLALAASVAAGCATTASTSSAAGAEPRSTSVIKRCSPDDPDRRAWFCVIGQILYGIAGGMQPDGGPPTR